MSAPRRQLLAIYDGRCLLCQRARRAASALDWRRRLAFADLHDRAAIQRIAPELSAADTLAALHLRLNDGRTLRGFPAIRRMLRELPLLAPLAWALYLPPLPALGRRLYEAIARNRPCLPEPPTAR